MSTTQRSRPQPPAAGLHGEGAVIVHGYNVLDMRDRYVFRGATGLTLRDFAPDTKLPLLCMVNGEYVLPADWELVEPCEGDQVNYLTLPMGGGGAGSMQTVLGIVLIVVGVIMENPGIIAAGAGMLLSGLLAPPTFTPLAATGATDAASPTYNIQLSGNSARLGQAMPVPYGRHILTPDFACAPYSEFDSTGNQFYHSVLCIGVMDAFTLESTMIDDTELSHFIGVETQLVGPQYTGSVTLVNPTVVNAPEVASQELVFGSYVGPFAACGPGLRAVKLGIDMVMPRGLYFANDTGTLTEKTVSWMAEARKINDAGAIAGNWFLLGSETLTLADNSAVRRTYTYTVTAGRYEVRVQRLDVRDTNARAGHEIDWGGMRAYLNFTAPLDDNANFLAIRMKANNQLSGLSQRRIAVILRRKLPTWSSGGGWTAPVETSSIAWALADVLRNPVYGAQVPDSRIDLVTLAELNTLWAARGDTFNGVFDKRVTVWSALTTIARAGRARPVMRGSVFTFIRDSQQELPVALFSMRNIQRGSFNVDYQMVTEDSVDGIELEFFDSATWSSKYVTMPVPGIVGEPLNPARASVIGISGTKQAQREAAYMAADSAYRRSVISFTTEMEGYLPAFGDLIAVSHDITGWGVSGEIVDYNGIQHVSSEELVWSVGDHYVIFTEEEGDVAGPFKVVPGTIANSFRLVSALFTPYTGAEKERTRFAFGPSSEYAKLCRVVSILPRSGDTVQIRAVVEDNRVHSADLPYAGADGSTSGSGGGGTTSGSRIARYAPPGIPNYNAASDAQHNAYGFFSTVDRKVGTVLDPGYVYDY